MTCQRLLTLPACLVFLLTTTPGCDDSHPPQLTGLSGRVLLAGAPRPDAVVYLARQYDDVVMPAPVVTDSTVADSRGRFVFTGLDAGRYRAGAGIWDDGGPGFSLVSPFGAAVDIGSKSAGWCELPLQPVLTGGSVAGMVLQDLGQGPEAAPGAEVTLWRYEGGHLVAAGAAVTNAAGHYAWTDIRTGNYSVSASLNLLLDSPYPSPLTGETPARFCDGASLLDMPAITLAEEVVRKPAIYLYPLRPTDFAVTLHLGRGARVTVSEPDYGAGWRVHVETDGRIDGRWEYLFYELGVAGWPRVRTGWPVPGDDLEAGLRLIVAALGLEKNESDDFLDYWLAHLPARPWYAVRPLVDAELDGLVCLDITPAPDTVRRFWLLFEGAETRPELEAPAVAPFVRRGIVAVEWGGALVR